jgi:opacity protein-like surface antigen
MNIKSLLLGSAAALAVVSGAQAADAVVAAEPEPMEYVKVCDAYGTGFFYLPGTETCVRIGGNVRYQKNWSKVGSKNASYDHTSRGRISVEAKNDSEWGTVYSWVELGGTRTNNGDLSLTANYWMGINGLEFGDYDTAWTRFLGYGGRTDDGGDNYGFDGRQYISYTADFGAASAIIELDHDAEGGVIQGHKYMPDVSAAVKATMGDYEVNAAFAYDESDESFFIRKTLRGNIDMFGFTVIGLYSNSATNHYFDYDGFSAIVGVSAKVTDTVTLAKDFQYYDNGDWKIIGDVSWAVASGFSVRLSANYGDIAGVKTKGGFLRFDRSF